MPPEAVAEEDTAPLPPPPPDSVAKDAPSLDAAAAPPGWPSVAATEHFPVAGVSDPLPAPGESSALPDPVSFEAALRLSEAERRSVQIRLSLAGMSPGPADGEFGPRTREALADWQRSRDLPVTGALTADDLVLLRAETQTRYEARLAALRSARAAAAPSDAPLPPGRAPDEPCRRGAGGAILSGQGFACDVRLLREELFGR